MVSMDPIGNKKNISGGKRIMADMIIKKKLQESRGEYIPIRKEKSPFIPEEQIPAELPEPFEVKTVKRSTSFFQPIQKKSSLFSEHGGESPILRKDDMHASSVPLREPITEKTDTHKVNFFKKERTSSDIVLASRKSFSSDSKETRFSPRGERVKRRFSIPFSFADRWYLKKPFLIFYGVFTCMSFIFYINIFSKVTVEIVPRQQTVEVNTVVQLSTARASPVELETIHFEEERSRDREATGSKEVQEYASGKVIIYNAFSSEPQALVRRTRFATSDGKIYRIHEVVTVPGAEIVDGVIKPSSLEVILYADQPGEEYNIGLADFTVPGFKGTPRYEKFYGRSQIPMTGGYKGISKVATQQDADALAGSLHGEFSKELEIRSLQALPDHLIIPEGAWRIIVKERSFSPEIGGRGDTLMLRLTLSFDGLAVPFNELKETLTTRYVDKDNQYGGVIDIVGMKELTYRVEQVDFDKGKISLRISGTMHAVWNVDEQHLAANLAQSGFRKHMAVFGQYPFIEKANIIFSPSWWRFFPEETQKIIIKKNLEI